MEPCTKKLEQSLASLRYFWILESLENDMSDTRQDIMHFFLRGCRIQTQIVFPELLTVSLVEGLNQAEKPYLFLNSIVIETTNNSGGLILADLVSQLQQASATATHPFNRD